MQLPVCFLCFLNYTAEKLCLVMKSECICCAVASFWISTYLIPSRPKTSNLSFYCHWSVTVESNPNLAGHSCLPSLSWDQKYFTWQQRIRINQTEGNKNTCYCGKQNLPSISYIVVDLRIAFRSCPHQKFSHTCFSGDMSWFERLDLRP